MKKGTKCLPMMELKHNRIIIDILRSKGFVFKHKLNNKVYTKHQIKSLIKKYAKRSNNIYCDIRVTKRIELDNLGGHIRQCENGLTSFSKYKARDFTNKFCSLLITVPKSVIRINDETGKERSHETSCEFAKDDECNCWCGGKYHGIGGI